MIVSKIFKPVFNEQKKECLGMTLTSPVGVNLAHYKTGAEYVEAMHNGCFSFTVINCGNISEAIDQLKKTDRLTNVIAHLDKNTEYEYNGVKKSMLGCFALLYDFVDAFLISGFDELSDDVDQLIGQRMYNDEYRPILMQIPDNLLHEDIDEIITYCRMSNVDGLYISNRRLLKYAREKSGGSLTLIAENAGNADDVTGIMDLGADLVCLPAGKNLYRALCKGRRLIRRLHKINA